MLLDAGKLRRPPRHRHPEHHVVAAGQPAEQHAPRRLHQRVQRQRLLARRAIERRAQRRAERQHDLLAAPTGRRAPGRCRGASRVPSSRPASAVPPGRKRRRAVLPRDEAPDSRGTASPRGSAAALPPCRIGRKQLPHQDRRRPAVHQQVMVADQQPVPLRRQAGSAQTASAAAPQDRTAPAGRPRAISASRRCCSAASQLRQIDQPPRHRGPRQHHLHRPAQMLVPEARPQAGVPRRPPPAARPPARRHRARPQAQARAAPYRRPAPARRRAHGTAAPPAAATAAGCPRSLPVAALQPLDLALRQIDQRQIARRAARPRRAARHAAPAPSAPRNQLAARSRTAASPSSAGAKLQFAVSRGPVRPVQRQRVDLDRMRQRHRRIAAGQPRPSSRRSPAAAAAQSAPSAPPPPNRPR